MVKMIIFIYLFIFQLLYPNPVLEIPDFMDTTHTNFDILPFIINGLNAINGNVSLHVHFYSFFVSQYIFILKMSL